MPDNYGRMTSDEDKSKEDLEIVRANARLISQAPALLEACELVIEHYSKDHYEPAIIKCKKAIAAAKGE